MPTKIGSLFLEYSAVVDWQKTIEEVVARGRFDLITGRTKDSPTGMFTSDLFPRRGERVDSVGLELIPLGQLRPSWSEVQKEIRSVMRLRRKMKKPLRKSSIWELLALAELLPKLQKEQRIFALGNPVASEYGPLLPCLEGTESQRFLRLDTAAYYEHENRVSRDGENKVENMFGDSVCLMTQVLPAGYVENHPSE